MSHVRGGNVPGRRCETSCVGFVARHIALPPHGDMHIWTLLHLMTTTGIIACAFSRDEFRAPAPADLYLCTIACFIVSSNCVSRTTNRIASANRMVLEQLRVALSKRASVDAVCRIATTPMCLYVNADRSDSSKLPRMRCAHTGRGIRRSCR